MNNNKIMTVCDEIAVLVVGQEPTLAARKFLAAEARFPVLTEVALLTQVGSALTPLVPTVEIDKHKAQLAAHVRLLRQEVA